MRVKKSALLGTWELAENDSTYEIPAPSAGSVAPDYMRILVVDDEANARIAIRRVIQTEMPGIIVDEAKNGPECLALFAEHHQGILTMDLSMPGMDGFTAFGEIRDLCRDNKWQMPSVVFCTGFDPPHMLMNLVANDPAFCLLRKPVSNRTLADAIRRRLPHGK